MENLGYFPNYYQNLKNKFSDFEKELEKLKECKNERECIKFVEQLPCVIEQDDQLLVQRSFAGKDTLIAADLKEKASQAFKNKKWFEALLFYTRSYVSLPQDQKEQIAIVLANRSATLYHLEKYDETLIDIQRALDLDYPKELVYKLYERQARCYLAKRDYPSTISAFKKCISALFESNAPLDKRNKINLDAMSMIKLLERDPKTKKQLELQKKTGQMPLPVITIPDEKEYFSKNVEFDSRRETGRFARAAADIKVGDEILVEKPYVAVLLEKYSKTHCENCCIRTVIPVACPQCVDVVYCSEKCLSIASKSYHKYECGLLSSIWNSGASVNCHMALRIMASKPVSYFLQIADKVNEKLELQEIQQLPRDDYRRVSHLVRHEEERSAANLFHHTLMARFLLKCLQQGGYFSKDHNQEDLLTVAGLLLRNLEFIQFNTHEVAELHLIKAKNERKTVFVGGAIYPTLALFNHSCDPSIVRYFRGTTIHVNTIKPIEAGLEISENYGPIYTQEPREARQSKLKDLYWFDCTCDPCLENWPLFENLPTDVIRFRCDAPNNCTAVINVPPTCNDFMIKCVVCGETTNIFKGLKVMQDTEVMTRTACRLYEAGEYSKALNKFIDLVRIMYEVLAPPFPDFCECQQHVKDCFLHFGNSYDV